MRETLEETMAEVDGLTFKVSIERDDDSRRPWEECHGYGPVREAKRNFYDPKIQKAPGERVLHTGDYGSYSWVYDWNGALALAEKDGWGVSEENRPGNWDSLTKAQQREVAVQRDFDFLKAWCEDEWVWCGVCVTLMIEDDEGDLVEYDGPLTSKFHDSLWGVEYWQYGMRLPEKNSHVKEIIQDLCTGVASVYLKEQAEAQYWAERGEVTA